MFEPIKALWIKIARSFGFYASPSAIGVAMVAQVSEVTPVVRKKKTDRRPDSFGNFYYFDNLLNQLDDYFFFLRRLKSHDVDTYNLYKNVGGQIVNDEMCIYTEVPQSWRQGARPSFNMIHILNSKHDDENTITPKLMYFTKVKYAAEAQAINKPGDIYNLVFFYSERGKSGSYPASIYVHLAHDLTITPLKVRTQESVRVSQERKRMKTHSLRAGGGGKLISIGGGGSSFRTITRTTYTYPDLIIEHAKQKEKTPYEVVSDMFWLIAWISEYSNDGIQVSVRKGQTTGVFNIGMDRTPYFFKDRDKTVGATGQAKKIFHSVKAHERVLANGKVVPVKMSFRGERSFLWKGYDVLVSVAGKQHKELRDLEIAVEINDEVSDGYAPIGDISKKIAKVAGRA